LPVRNHESPFFGVFGEGEDEKVRQKDRKNYVEAFEAGDDFEIFLLKRVLGGTFLI
jgi:hypothetical protein